MTSFTKMLNYFLSPKLFTQQVLVKIFFVILASVGLFSYQDYGYTRDEAINRWRGIVTAHYIGELWNIDYLKNVDPLRLETRNQFSQLSPTEAEHGALFETISAILEKVVLSNTAVDERSIYFFRHLLIYLVFISGVYAVFCMAKRRFSDWRVGLLAAGMLVLSPRIYGNAFFNSNDIVFLATFALAANWAIELIVRPNWRASLMAGLLAGIAIATRNLAILIPLAVAMIFIISTFKEIASQKLFPTKHFVGLMAYLLVSLIATIVCWPWLWEDPFGRLAQSFTVMSRIPFEMYVLYFGQLISTFDIPWHYAPVWIGITTPLIYLVLFGIGVGAILRQLWICKWGIYSNKSQLQDLFFLGLFSAPLLAVMILHASLYDSWRHLFFIYPFLVLVAVRGWIVIWAYVKRYQATKIGASAILISALVFNGIWMTRAHPFESFYFNSLAGKNWKSQFDVDYWSLGVRQALEFVVRHDNRAYVRVGSVSVMTDLGGLRVMDPSERARVLGVSSDLTADYMIQIYREDSRDLAKIDLNYRLFHEIKVGNEVALSIYQNKNHRPLPGVDLNERVAFSSGSKGVNYLVGVGIADRIGSSWHHPEPWGVWAATEQVFLAIPRPSKAPHTLTLELLAPPLGLGGAQKVEISVNGQPNQTVLLGSSKPTPISIALLPTQLTLNYVLLDFKVVEPLKPITNEGSKDGRWLGVGLVSATFD
jgi:hypothetical protein